MPTCSLTIIVRYKVVLTIFIFMGNFIIQFLQITYGDKLIETRLHNWFMNVKLLVVKSVVLPTCIRVRGSTSMTGKLPLPWIWCFESSILTNRSTSLKRRLLELIVFCVAEFHWKDKNRINSNYVTSFTEQTKSRVMFVVLRNYREISLKLHNKLEMTVV